jgi:hypothetical protein
MSNYVPNHQKKQRRLTEQEDRLTQLIAEKATTTELLNAAESVRAARVRAFRSKQAELPPCEKNSDRWQAFDEMIRHWLGLTSEAIVEAYRLPESQRSAAIRSAQG